MKDHNQFLMIHHVLNVVMLNHVQPNQDAVLILKLIKSIIHFRVSQSCREGNITANANVS